MHRHCNSIAADLLGSSFDAIPSTSATSLKPPKPRRDRLAPMHSRHLGGYDFRADPALSADRQPVFWSAQALPSVLRLTSAVSDLAPVGRPMGGLFAAAATRIGDDGLHAVWVLDNGELRAWADASAQAGRPAVVLPLDDAIELRALTAIRLWRLLNRLPPGPDPVSITSAGRARLVQTLRVLDARHAGASLRDIAEALFQQRITGRAWQGSSLHARTKRLVRSGLALMQGGYRQLLSPAARRRGGRGDEEPTP